MQSSSQLVDSRLSDLVLLGNAADQTVVLGPLLSYSPYCHLYLFRFRSWA